MGDPCLSCSELRAKFWLTSSPPSAIYSPAPRCRAMAIRGDPVPGSGFHSFRLGRSAPPCSSGPARALLLLCNPNNPRHSLAPELNPGAGLLPTGTLVVGRAHMSFTQAKACCQRRIQRPTQPAGAALPGQTAACRVANRILDRSEGVVDRSACHGPYDIYSFVGHGLLPPGGLLADQASTECLTVAEVFCAP